MGKKRGGGGGNGEGKASAPSNAAAKKPRSYLVHAGIVVCAACAQAIFMTYYRNGAPATAADSPADEVLVKPPPPAVCPAGWGACPRIPGIDWVRLLDLQSSAAAEVSPANLASCEPSGSLLSAEQVAGMHLVCVLPPPAGEDAVAATLAIYRDMEARHAPVVVLLPKRLGQAEHAVAAIRHTLRLKERSGKYQASAIFTDVGIRVESVGGMVRAALESESGSGRFVLMEGGQWLWPPVRLGHVHILPNLTASGVDTRVVTVSMKPLVVEVENFLSASENRHIIDHAEPHMAKSGVALKDADVGKAAKEFRTSSQYFLPTVGDKLLEKVDKRVMMLTRIPITHAEYIQVLKYQHLEHYSAHHDFFDPAAYASNPEMLASVEHGARNRLATVFFYLNNVSAGGQTNFPRASSPEHPHGAPPVRDYFDCSNGLSVFPQEGKVIIFYSMLANGEMDDLSLHGGCDVLDEAATKWSANFWLWNKPYHFQSPVRKRQSSQLMSQWL